MPDTAFHSDKPLDDWLFDLYDRMLGEVKLPAVLEDVARAVCEDRKAQRAAIYLVDHATAELKSVVTIGNVAQIIHVPIDDQSLAGYCATHQKAFHVPDAYGDLSGIAPGLHFDDAWDRLNNFRTRDVLCAPAIFKNTLVGVVQLINGQEGHFTPDDLAPLKNVARIIGYALYHARLYDDLATMRRLEHEKAAFMRLMVHELKSPVAAVKMMAELLSRKAGGDAHTVEMAARIARRGDHMIQLIQDLTELAYVKSATTAGKVEVLDLVEQTQTVAEHYREQARAKSLAFETHLPPQRLAVRIDTKACELIVSNLISNAVKYTSAGSIQVRLRREDSWAVLSVADTGMGVSEQEIPKLFQEFYRAANARASGIAGTGVGLAGAKALAERFGGGIELQTALGTGSTFTVRLPLQNAPSPAAGTFISEAPPVPAQ
ncbi:MAG: GAF domain-containing sensor histidine kinase [Planctomycetaceae bacterium]|nr:GAF domain-containing sensor histidine kinase [Planctomycetaceae bacterium]